MFISERDECLWVTVTLTEQKCRYRTIKNRQNPLFGKTSKETLWSLHQKEKAQIVNQNKKKKTSQIIKKNIIKSVLEIIVVH